MILLTKELTDILSEIIDNGIEEAVSTLNKMLKFLASFPKISS